MRRNKHLLLWSSLTAFALLAFSAYQENVLREWRGLQREYRSLLPPGERNGFATQLRQVVVPSLGAVDRCVTCHLGMAPGETAIEQHPVFGSHPDVVHDPASYGCTTCHAGQGLATTSDDAHGVVAHWPQPMIPARYTYAGCGTCHSHLEVPSLARLRHGRSMIERADCLACHALEGRGGTLRPGQSEAVSAPDLSRASTGVLEGWYERHLGRHDEADGGPWRESFGALAREDLADIDVYLASRVGAPGLIEAKATFHSLGCRGCHTVGGVGGDDGPDLTLAGQKDPGQVDFTHVEEQGDLSAWMAEHFRAPALLVANSAMPALGLSEKDIDALVFFLHSLRRSELPEAYWPNDRIATARFGAREFSTDGATLYGAFCASCHGPGGEGMRYAGMPPFPAIAARDFLAIASDEFLRETIRRGRPGRRMPAWGELEGGLRATEIDALVSHLRSLGGVAFEPDSQPPRWISGDAALGESLYARHCAACHGEQGEGGEGPALANRVLLATASDTYLRETILRGRESTSMPAFGKASTTNPMLASAEVEALVAHIRTWENDS